MLLGPEKQQLINDNTSAGTRPLLDAPMYVVVIHAQVPQTPQANSYRLPWQSLKLKKGK